MRRPEDFEHATADLAGIRLHYVREGERGNPPVFLLHGWPGFWWDWHRNIGPLAGTLDVIVPDMRGCGQSEKPPAGEPALYHMDRVVDDLVALADHLGLGRFAVVGHDFGAVVAHKIVRRHRERVSRAVIVDPIVPGYEDFYLAPEHAREAWYAHFHNLDMAAELVGSSRATCRTYFAHFFAHWSHAPDLFDDAMLDVYVDNYMQPGNIRGGFDLYRPADEWSDIDRTITDCPTLFLQGVSDPVIPARWTDLVTRWYKDFAIAYLADAGHFVMVERPDELNARVSAFLAG